MQALNELNKEELQTKLKDLEDLLEEVYEKKGIILGQQNVHLSSKLVNKYAREVEDINGKRIISSGMVLKSPELAQTHKKYPFDHLGYLTELDRKGISYSHFRRFRRPPG